MDKREKIRIMHIAQCAGGVDRYLQMLMKYLDKEKFENILVCSFNYRPEDFENYVEYFEQIDIQHSIGLHDFKSAVTVRKLIRKYSPDIVYAHSSKAGAVARMADFGIKNICIYNPHGWAFNMRCSKIKQMIYVVMEKIMALFCNKIICISEAEKKSALDKRICKKNKLQVIFNGIDVDSYKNQTHGALKRVDLGIPEDAFVVGMVGRLSPQKAPDVFIKTARKLKNDIKNSYFIIVGNGKLEEEIRNYTKEHGFADSLLITGWVDNATDYVKLFDVAMLLSRWEGFGLALPEYMIAKKPIVATRVDAIPSIIKDHENGLLVEVDDVDGAYKSVMKLYGDSMFRNKLVSQSIKDVHDKFDVKRVSKQHVELFELMLRD